MTEPVEWEGMPRPTSMWFRWKCNGLEHDDGTLSKTVHCSQVLVPFTARLRKCYHMPRARRLVCRNGYLDDEK